MNKVLVQCKDCTKTWLKAKSSLPIWQGRCGSCAQKTELRKDYRIEISRRNGINVTKKFGGVLNAKKFISERVSGEKSNNWKGDLVGYFGLHTWVQRRLGKPNRCEHCGNNKLSSRHYHWANKSRLYKRDLNDWLRLCAKCHSAYDKNYQLT